MKIPLVFAAILILSCLLYACLSAAEIDTNFATANTPSLGNYHVQYLHTFINKDKHLTEGYKYLADLNFSEAIKHLNACIAKRGNIFINSANSEIILNPKLTSEDKLILSEAYTFLGYCYMNEGKKEQAKNNCRRAIILNPNNEYAYFYLGNTFFQEGDTEQMRVNLNKSLKINKTFTTAMRILAESYRDEGDHKKANEYYKRIVDYLPESGYYRFQYYRSLMSAREYKLAEQQIKKMISLQPDFMLNYKRLGDIYARQGKYQNALNEYNSLLNKLPKEDNLRSQLHIGKADVYISMDELQEAKKELAIVQREGKGSGEIQELKYKIENIEKEKIKNIATAAIACILGVILLGINGYFIYSKKKRTYIEKVLSDFNEALQKVANVQELAAFLPEFFSHYLKTITGFLMVYNRQNNSLNTIKSHLVYNTEPISIVTGSDVDNWTFQESKPIMSIRELIHSKLFDKAFPSLAKRLEKLQVGYVIVLKDRKSFIGFITMGEMHESNIVRKKITFDLLEPLIAASSQTLQTEYLIETSISDDLTDLYNKKHLYPSLIEELKRADRYRQPCSLCFLDMDDFKSINETYGHSQGDLILKGIGKIIKENVREGIDIGIRAGGEEFAIILPATTSDLAALVADRIRKTVQSATFEGFETHKTITLSIGISTYPDLAISDNDLVETAKSGLQNAKKNGKNRVCVYDGQQNEEETKKKRFQLQAGQAAFETIFDHLNIKDLQSGLPSYSYFSMKIQDEIKRCDRYRLTCSMLIFSIYPEIPENKQEEVSKTITEILTTKFREGIDLPSKLNDSSFLLLAPETSKDKGAILAKRMQNALADKNILSETGQTLRVIAAVASYPDCADTGDELLNKLITALDMAKLMDTGICVCGSSNK